MDFSLQMVACFAYTTVKFYAHDMHLSAEAGETAGEYRRSTTTPSDSKIYQACQSDPSLHLPLLKNVHTWKGRDLAHSSVSIVTQLSLERLSMLRSQCRVWTDKITAAVYIPYMKGFGVISDEVRALNGSTLQDIVIFVDDFYHKLERDAPCSLDLELVLEKFTDWNDPSIGLYPFNAVRNRALKLVETESVMLLDADFMPSKTLSLSYQKKPSVLKHMIDTLDKKVAFVLPAFETSNRGLDGKNIAKKISLNGKEELLTAWSAGQVEGFQVEQYPAGHGPTQFDRWLNASSPYSIKYRKGFEPYILVHRKYVPWYDERFRGYGRDKIVHLTHIADQLGIKLQVHNYAFVVHSPHDKSSTFKKTKESGQWENLLDLYIKVRRDISLQEFVPITSFADTCPKVVLAHDVALARKKKLKQRRLKRKLKKKNSKKSLGEKNAS